MFRTLLRPLFFRPIQLPKLQFTAHILNDGSPKFPTLMMKGSEQKTLMIHNYRRKMNCVGVVSAEDITDHSSMGPEKYPEHCALEADDPST